MAARWGKPARPLCLLAQAHSVQRVAGAGGYVGIAAKRGCPQGQTCGGMHFDMHSYLQMILNKIRW